MRLSIKQKTPGPVSRVKASDLEVRVNGEEVPYTDIQLHLKNGLAEVTITSFLRELNIEGESFPLPQ